MARFFGTIGYRDTREVRNGIWKPTITERQYFGDVIKRSSRMQESSETENSEMTFSNEISVIADPFAYERFADIVYAVWMNRKWAVTRVEVKMPRLILSIGGIYNDPSESDGIYYPPYSPAPEDPVLPPDNCNCNPADGTVNCDHVVATDKEANEILDQIFTFGESDPQPNGYEIATKEEIQKILGDKFNNEEDWLS